MSTHKSSKSKKRHRNVNSSASSSSIQAQTRQRAQVYDTANIVLDVTANIAEGSDILAPLKAVCRATKSILEVMRAIESNKEEWIDLTRRLKEYMSTFEEQIASFETYSQAERVIGEALNRPLNHYIELLRDIHSTVVDLREKRSRSKLSLLKGFSRVKVDSEEIRKLNRDVEDRHRQLMSALGLFTASRVQAIERSVAILQLPTVAFVASSVHRLCLEGTREAVLQTIWNWANDSASDKPIFWLCDIAGSGKSTVAMSAVESWRKKGVLGGRFFFSMASSEGSTTDKFCSTIARDLVQYIPELIPHVAGAVKQNPSFMRSSLGEQLQILVTDPFIIGKAM
ncbi:SubName: Full=Related to WD40-repeat protein (Notchless protein) {ECO:0000313/EMBL:CCA73885.1} [Serendipita indica DSM 11827]|nr:SubName: Full=Related to WD40-repeat protein (Notchless protein) {ECO:0000313/EMBL:CCA73885.1} [Serendipita indica DSM 11827]